MFQTFDISTPDFCRDGTNLVHRQQNNGVKYVNESQYIIVVHIKA